MIKHPRHHPLTTEHRNCPGHPFRADTDRPSEAETTRHQIIKNQSDRIKRSLPPTVARDQEELVFHQMRSIMPEQAPFTKRFMNQSNIALRQITDTSMYQFRTPAGSSLRKVRTFKQSHAVSAGHGIERHTQTGSPPANHDKIKYPVFVIQLRNDRFPFHIPRH